ncbi:hypothetical protein [Oligoflexus tunisiensis]|uniref:hypothetical protein n=1 Tax=Oligoflexus tunisiensis TaxID=708132 RepID=UPI00114D3850|nr:hypothetical protein [Oligoflexus tunisiensis]
MRSLLLLLIWSLVGSAAAAPKVKKKRAAAASRSEDLRMWDGSVADVDWVNDNESPKTASRSKESRHWVTLSAGAGHRVFKLDTVMVQKDQAGDPLNEGLFTDLVDSHDAFEVRALVHPFSFLSMGVSYHMDDAKLKVNSETASIAPQEYSGLVQIGPRFGFLRLYGFYSQIFASRSQASISAATRVGEPDVKQSFQVDVKQSGGEGGVGTSFYWGPVGLYAEAVRSVNRSYELSLADSDGVTTFQAYAQPTFKAWQFGLSLNF